MSIPTDATVVTVKPEDFDVQWTPETKFPFFEDENADGLYGYGHKDKAEFARLVNEYDRLCDSGHDPEDDYTTDDVTHSYVVAYRQAGWGEGDWMFTREGVTAETPGAFPMTWISR